MVSPGSSFALSNSMCSTVEKVMAAQAASSTATPLRHRHRQPRRQFTSSCAKPSTWKPSTPETFSQRLSRPSRQARQWPQVQRAIGRRALADAPAGHAGADRHDLAHRLGAHRQRQAALGEGHAAPAPDVDVVQRDGAASAAAPRPGRAAAAVGHLDQPRVTVAEQLQRAHRPPAAASAPRRAPGRHSARRSRRSWTAPAPPSRRAPRSAPRRA